MTTAEAACTHGLFVPTGELRAPAGLTCGESDDDLSSHADTAEIRERGPKRTRFMDNKQTRTLDFGKRGEKAEKPLRSADAPKDRRDKEYAGEILFSENDVPLILTDTGGNSDIDMTVYKPAIALATNTGTAT